MNVTRRQIRAALEGYHEKVRATGHTTLLELSLFEALDGIVNGSVIESDIERALAARLQKAEAMLDEVAALEHDEYYTFAVDDVVRDDDGHVVTIFGTRDLWRHVRGSIDGDAWFEKVNQEPYIIGEV